MLSAVARRAARSVVAAVAPRALSALMARRTLARSVRAAAPLQMQRVHAARNPVFEPTPANGYLPMREPLARLPARFDALESLLQRMPVRRVDGSVGLLANAQFGPAVDKELGVVDVSDVTDPDLLVALYRDYSFAASAYLLEECDMRYRASKTYGLGRDRLPKSIAQPLVKVADKLGALPFMEYAMSYALYNWQRIDAKGPMHFDNLRLIRAFHGSEAERGFILVHVTMVSRSGEQVKNTLGVLNAAADKDQPALLKSLKAFYANMRSINDEMETMWKRSSAIDYNSFRTFIFGIKNQPMFPKGVVYEGCFDDKPQFDLRGESGANDSIIPTCDNLFELKFRENPLTEVLRDFRRYRPAPHNEWLSNVANEAARVHVRDQCVSSPATAVWYLANIDTVREFRQRHWNFTKEYIIKHSKHGMATGGSPIVTWLPNQLGSVIHQMEDLVAQVDASRLGAEDLAVFDRVRKNIDRQRSMLMREVEELSKAYPDQSAYYAKNEVFAN